MRFPFRSLRSATITSALVLSCGVASAFAACSSNDDTPPPPAADTSTADVLPETTTDSVVVPDADASPESDAPLGNVTVQILAVNDFHGNLEPPSGSGGLVTAPLADPITDAGAEGGVKFDPDAGTAKVPAGGAAFLATHIKNLKATNPNTVIVSAGDLTGASPLISNVFKDEPAVLVWNSIGLEFNGVGNHEFDRGEAELLRLQKGGCSLGDCDAGTFPGAKFTYLAANVDETKTSATIFPPYGIKDVGGVKIGFIGLTLENTPSVTVASAIVGLEFKNEIATVNALVPDLKAKGVSAIVVLVHQGGVQAPTGTYDTCDTLTGDIVPISKGLDPAVDVVVSAHTHQAYDCMVDGRLLTSAASFGRIVTKIDLVIDPNTKKVVSKKAKNLAVTRDVTPDPTVAALVADYKARSAPLAGKIVGYIAGDLVANPKTIASKSCETTLGDVIADAQLAATSDPTLGNAVIAFMNPGGIRTDILAKAAGKADGSVTYGEAFATQPFTNLLVTMTLTGSQIVTLLNQQFTTTTPAVLQVSKNFTYSYAWDATTKKGTVDATSIMISGVALDTTKSYRVTVNNFLAGGGDGFLVLKDGTARITGSVDLDALIAYLGKLSTATSPLPVPALARITGLACQ